MSVVRYTKSGKENLIHLKRLVERHKPSSAFNAFIHKFGKDIVVSSSGAMSATTAASTAKKKK